MALVVLGACGRIGFSPRVDGAVGDDDGDVDADGDAPTACASFGPWSAPMAQTTLNQGGGTDDFGVQIAPDGLFVVFDSDRVPTHDLFTATRTSTTAAWSTPVRQVPLATPNIDTDATVTADLLDMILVNDNTGGSWCLYESKRATATAQWSEPVRLDAICVPFEPHGPWISGDGLRLYYNSVDDGSAHGRVFYTERATRSATFPAGTQLTELETGIGFVALTADELEIYYERGSPIRIFHAVRPSMTTPFGAPSLVTETVSGSSDGDVSITADGTILMWASTRAGAYDIYAMTRSCL